MAALEEGWLAALMRDGCGILEAFFLQHVPECAGQRRPGERHYHHRHLQVQSVLGRFSLWRDYFYDGENGRAPLDEQLGLKDSLTPGLQRLMSRAGAMSGSFEQASDDLKAYARLDVPGRSIQRLTAVVGPDIQSWMQARPTTVSDPVPKVLYVSYDGTGVPMARSETRGRKGKQADGSAKGREVKLGCVFTQLRTTQGEPPLRDPDSTTYVASFGEASDFGGLIRKEAQLRGLAHAQKVVVLGDGAPWIWEVARVNFPGATCILDLYHAYEHVNEIAAIAYPNESPKTRHARQWRHWLKAGKVDRFIAAAKRRARTRPTQKQEILRSLQYFLNNRARMQYAKFRRASLFVGSGVVEAGCKTVVGQRTKQSGMFWHVQGAQHVLSTRCAILGNLFDSYWAKRKPA